MYNKHGTSTFSMMTCSRTSSLCNLSWWLPCDTYLDVGLLVVTCASVLLLLCQIDGVCCPGVLDSFVLCYLLIHKNVILPKKIKYFSLNCDIDNLKHCVLNLVLNPLDFGPPKKLECTNLYFIVKQ